MRAAVLLALVAGLAGLSATASADVPRVEERVYHLGTGLLSPTTIAFGCDDPVGVGGACFDLDGSERQVRIDVLDDMARDPQAIVSIYSEDGEQLHWEPFCSSVVRPIPEAAGRGRVRVTIDAPLVWGVECDPLASNGQSGFIYGTFT